MATRSSVGEHAVSPTPLPFTPLSHRHELGVSPVRLRPRSNPQTPKPAKPVATPGTLGEDSWEQKRVLCGTIISVKDAKSHLTQFVKEFTVQMQDKSVPLYIDSLQHLAETSGSIVNVDMNHLSQRDSSMRRKLLM